MRIYCRELGGKLRQLDLSTNIEKSVEWLEGQTEALKDIREKVGKVLKPPILGVIIGGKGKSVHIPAVTPTDSPSVA